LIQKVSKKVKSKQESVFIELSKNLLFNGLVDCVNSELSRKIGAPPKPSATGFQKYASNRIQIELKVNEIIKNLEIAMPEQSDYVGNLGDKGDLKFNTTIIFQNKGTVEPLAKLLADRGSNFQFAPIRCERVLFERFPYGDCIVFLK
jgi:hypothetical protein